jgi:hypothetical protein
MGAVSTVVASNTGFCRLDGTSGVSIAIISSGGDPGDEPHPASSFLGGGASCASRASGGEADSAGDAARSGGASNKKPTPKNTPTGAIATTLREARWRRNTNSCLVTALIV